jgi:hypothetical protein
MAEEQYISGEEHRANSHAKAKNDRQVVVQTRWLTAIAAALVLCGLSFWGGTAYQKHHDKTTLSANSAASGNSFGGRAGGTRGMGALGQVTAVSGTSITITNQRTGTGSTYAISSTTAISDNGQTAAASDIQTGDTVLITTASGNTAAATRILVNPNFGGGGFGGASAPSGSINQ